MQLNTFVSSLPFASPSYNLLSPVLLHHQNLYHPNEDVQEVQLQANALIDRILWNSSLLSQPSVHQNFLDIIESKTTEDCQSSPQPDVLSESECSDSGGWEDERSESRDSDERNTSKERSTKVQVFLLLSGCTNE